MRKIRIFEHISLDGVIEHGEEYAYGAWTAPYRNPAGKERGQPCGRVFGGNTRLHG